jgi:two-component system chemotaxis response regulator CheY
MRILLIDDNEELRDFLAATLNENAIDAVAAESAEDAVRLQQQEKFDAFIVDSVMGETDGIALIQELRNTKNGRGTPALLMSNISTSLARRMAQNASCAFLAKPFGPTQLIDHVRGLR